jgi:hypothetical protein
MLEAAHTYRADPMVKNSNLKWIAQKAASLELKIPFPTASK